MKGILPGTPFESKDGLILLPMFTTFVDTAKIHTCTQEIVKIKLNNDLQTYKNIHTKILVNVKIFLSCYIICEGAWFCG